VRGLVILLLLTSCAAEQTWRRAPHDRVYQHVPPPIEHPLPPPRHVVYEWWQAASRGAIEPLAHGLSPRTALELLIEREEAGDLNHFGQVVGSTWFEPRLGARTMSTEAVAKGNALRPPAPGALLVLGGKLSGATPGMVVEDSTGARFVVKFDPPGFPEMSSAAEVIVSRALHAAGWFVPENYLYDIRVDSLTLAPGATTRGEYNEEVPLTSTMLRALIANVNPRKDGTVRAMLSRFIPGKIIGAGSFRTRHHDDPNEALWPTDRRSMRGLGLFYNWMNNIDGRDSSTIATWIASPSDPRLGHIEHYLIDFGDSLGGAGYRAKFPGEGYELRVDWTGIASQFFSLGFYYHYWLPVRRAPFRAVGFFESEIYVPEKWRPSIPNPSFEAMTVRDRYWAGSLIARFTPEMITALVAEAKFSEHGAAQFVAETLRARQEKILGWAFAPVLPLDDPRVDGSVLSLTDLAAYAGVVPGGLRTLSWRAYWDNGLLTAGEIEDSREIAVDLGPALARFNTDRGAVVDADPFVTVRFIDPTRPELGVNVHLRVDGKRLVPVGLDRDLE